MFQTTNQSQSLVRFEKPSMAKKQPMISHDPATDEVFPCFVMHSCHILALTPVWNIHQRERWNMSRDIHVYTMLGPPVMFVGL